MIMDIIPAEMISYRCYNLDMLDYKDAFDLLGSTVVPPVIKYVADSLLYGNAYAAS